MREFSPRPGLRTRITKFGGERTGTKPPHLHILFKVNIQLLSFTLVHTVDCSVQTEAMPVEVLYAYDNPAAIDDEYKGNELVLDISSKARVVS